MRIALIHSFHNQNNPNAGELFSRLPNIELSQFYLEDNRVFTHDRNQISLHDVAIQSDFYVLDPDIPHQVRENMHHYFESYAVEHVYGQVGELKSVPHEFLLPKSLELNDAYNDIERALVTLWTSIAHPIRIKRKRGMSQEVSSIHELRRQALPHVLQGEHMECIYQPKGRKLTCTLLRNARGKKVYTTPLFEKITHSSGEKLTTSSLSHSDKEEIIKKLEELFAHHPSIPTLHIELTHTPKGIYLMHAEPIQDLHKDNIPETLHAVGMQPYEVLTSCLASLSAK